MNVTVALDEDAGTMTVAVTFGREATPEQVVAVASHAVRDALEQHQAWLADARSAAAL